MRHSPALLHNTTPSVWRDEDGRSPQAALAEHLASTACRGSFLAARATLDILGEISFLQLLLLLLLQLLLPPLLLLLFDYLLQLVL